MDGDVRVRNTGEEQFWIVLWADLSVERRFDFWCKELCEAEPQAECVVEVCCKRCGLSKGKAVCIETDAVLGIPGPGLASEIIARCRLTAVKYNIF